MKNENIICVPTSEIRQRFDLTKTSWKIAIEEINTLPYQFLPRPEAETDFSQKQLIPYAIVQNPQGEVLCYQRAGSENRLLGIWSAGIGGHVNDGDKGASVFDTLCNGLVREFGEEICITPAVEQMTLAGMINEEETEVGHCHIGVVFRIILEEMPTDFDREISHPVWMAPSEMDFTKFELWSGLAIKLVMKL